MNGALVMYKEQFCHKPKKNQQGPSIASRFEAQPDLCGYGSMAAPQGIYMTT